MRQGRKRKLLKLLITAFEPFGGRKINASAEIMKRLKSPQANMGFTAYSYATLPVDFRRAWPTLRRHLRAAQPNAVLLLGEKADASLAIETMARNRRISPRGFIRISRSTPPEILSAINAEKIFATSKTRNGFSKNFFKLSNDAGTYLCNFIYYKMLSERTDIPALFVHVPALGKRQLARQMQKLARGIKIVGQQLIKAIDGAGAKYTSREN